MSWPSRNEPCLCGSQKKVKNCCSELFHQIRPDSFVGKLIKTHSYIASIYNNGGYQRINTFCSEDCSASCCYTLFPISFIEDFYIRLDMSTWPKEKIQNLLSKANNMYQEVREKFPELELFNNISGGLDVSGYEVQQAKKLISDFTAIAENILDLPCPFLEKNRCLIYRSRPLICRTFGSFKEAHSCDKIDQLTLPSIKLEKLEHWHIFGFESIGKPIIIWLNNIVSPETLIAEEEILKLCKVPSNFVSLGEPR